VFFTYFNIKGVTFTKTGAGTGDTSLRLRKMVRVNFNDVVFLQNTVGLRASDLVLSDFYSTTFRFNNYGCFMEGQIDSQGSTPNAINFYGCVYYGNSEYAGLFVGGCNVNMFGGSVETTSGGVQAIRFGIKIDNPGTYGRAACAFYGTYFERNGNAADVWVNAGDAPVTAVFSGCTFNRLLNTEFSVNNILFATNNNLASRHYLTVEGCAFSRMGSYTASASRRYIDVTGSTPVQFRDIGNMYGDAIERPIKPSGDMLARASFTGAGALVRGHNVSSITKTGTGQFTLNFVDSNTNITSGRTVSIASDILGWARVASESATAVAVIFTNTSGAAADPGIGSVVVYE
jgi:hypothetical protein